MYCRAHGGIITECEATAEVGFARDEPWEELGINLLLPPWFEHQRAEIVKMLEPITVPEENLPTSAGIAARQAAVSRSGGSTTATERSGAAVLASQRRDATFIGGDK